MKNLCHLSSKVLFRNSLSRFVWKMVIKMEIDEFTSCDFCVLCYVQLFFFIAIVQLIHSESEYYCQNRIQYVR